MHPVVYAVVILVGLSGGALAQNSNDQSPGKKGTTGWQAPINHRQPTLKTLPPNVVRQEEQAPSASYEKFDNRMLDICKGC